MDYKEKYEQALENIKKIKAANKDNKELVDFIENKYPELKESEDENIRDEIISYIKSSGAVTNKNWIAWLEKQGELNTFSIPQTPIKDATEVKSRINYISDDMKPIAEFIMGYANWNLHKDEWNQPTLTVPLFRVLDALIQRGKPYCECIQNTEKKDEQKPVDKIEPKFKVGDWVVYCNEDVDLIMGVGKTGYIINEGGGYIPFVCENDMHIWTIQDAKDGDILVKGSCIYLFSSKEMENGFLAAKAYLFNDELYCGETLYIDRNNVKPATKKQRNLIFQKMKEAGYEWDAEKKELKKIKQKLVEWSEEDEKERKRVVGLLEGWLYTFKETCYAEDCKCGIAWLKSLKERMEV